MRNGRLLVALGFALLAAVLGLARTASGVEEELLERARKLVADAKPLIEQANDVDLPMSKRKEPRKQAFLLLKDARGTYDKYFELNRYEEEKLDAEYVEMMVLLHGIKKDSGLGELEKEEEPAPPAPAPPEEAPKTVAERARIGLAAVHAAEKTRPGDLPRIQRLYAAFLAEFCDPALPECTEAAQSLGRVNDRIKTVYRSAVKRDFDSLSGGETADEQKFTAAMATGLKSKSPEGRRAAVGLLVATRSRSATPYLARGVADTDPEFAKVCREGLVAIGGASVGDNLSGLYRYAPQERRRVAFEVLATLARKNDAEAASQSAAIGAFAVQGDDPVVREANKFLVSMGRLGGPGLFAAVRGIDDLDRKCAAMARLAEARYYRGAYLLATDYLVETRGNQAAGYLYQGAVAAIDKMGVQVVPHLANALGGPSGRAVAEILTKHTGFTVGLGDRIRVLDWWAAHKPKDAE